tara:strand:- start:436 stop:900 length:465 start_codon:yes stop_codon:yes gene_type:complete
MSELKNIQLIVYDFDGVMTNNKVYIDNNGNELVQVNRSDGLAVSEIKRLGVNQIIISTEKNLVVAKRANKLNIPFLQNINNKKDTLINYCKKNNFNLKNIIYVGNDINDKEAMSIAGFTYCPSDAHDIIKGISDTILDTKGGDGVIRELLDIIT